MLGVSGPAWAAPPPTPDFGPAIEPLAPLVSQSTCDPTAKPGVVGFKDLLVGHYGHHNWNIDRPCSWGGTSEHKEGRALDFALNANNSTQNARANEILNWLLATDRHGNAHALARRFGIMYLIWNKRIWSASRASEGWRPYDCTPGDASDCHTDHIHFSFSWPGARKETSWWSGGHSIGADRIQYGDFNGDGLADLLQVRDNGDVVVFWNSGGNPNFSWSNNRLVLTGIPNVDQVRVGDFNGDGLADLLQVRDNGDVVVFWNSGGNPNFSWSNNRLVLTGITNAGQVRVGDFNGDGLADLLQVRDNGDVVVFWNSGGNPNFSWSNNRLVLTGITNAGQVRVGDFNGDGLADLLQVRDNGDVVVFWNSGGNPNFSWSNNRLVLTGIPSPRQIGVGDFNNDGLGDVSQVRDNGNVVVFWNSGGNPNFSWSNNRLVLTGIYL
ncbi:FG-GAP repeat domain-containing protein [Verrucosispora sp. WMMD703]|uniref:FG-GAP repeat domain-containing protein n=1 Tax=Verrucosispora sp. WMMD703 TaxID=3403463 RepID=UPI003B947463